MTAVALSPASVHVSDATLARIRRQVEDWRAPPAPDDEGAQDWARGTNTAFLLRLRDRWLDGFDWRAVEARLNARPQVTATIDGHAIHALHVTGEAGGRRPLLLIHGWPGSILEFVDLIEPLAFPSRFGGDPADAFDLVIPSLPGYGFSGRPGRPIGQRATAGLFRGLMGALGHDRFLVQGGDWGSMVGGWLAFDHPDAVAGLHLNFTPFKPDPDDPHTDEERAWLARAGFAMRLGGAYLMMQATKPQTLALALHDHPMGQAAWIVEKFHGWSDLSAGTLETVHGLDRLIANVMVYAATDTFQTSVWYYRALIEENGGNALPKGRRVEVPTAFAAFPGETLLPAPPRSWMERTVDLVRWTDMPRGGHFAAMEAPDLLIDDVRAFAREIGFSLS